MAAPVRRGVRPAVSPRVRRPMVSIAVLALAAAAAAACSPAGSDDKEAGGGDKAGATMVVARSADIDILDPHKATAFATVQTLSLVYDRLVTTDKAGTIIPSLAEKWEIAPDAKSVTFTLRSDVTWHDGDPFTAADVKATLDRILDEKTASVARSNLAMISKVDTPDDRTVTLTMSTPNAAILYALSSTNASILHAKDIAADTVARKPDGTGPFSFGKWDQGQQLTLDANPKYFEGAPKVGRLQFRVIPSESSILAGMRAGRFQLGAVSDPSIAKQAAGSSGMKLVKQPTLAYHALMLNGRRGPLKNVKVRQAIACAIDRQQVVETAAFGDGKVTGPITSPAFTYDETAGLPCTPGDTAGAKRLLSDAGQGNGFTITTIVQNGEYATAAAEAQNVQSQLAKIGVTLKLQQLASATFVKQWLAADYDAAVALNGGSSDPYLMYGRYFTDGGSLAAPAGLASSELADLLVQGNGTTDEAERQRIYGELQKKLLELSPWVWMFRGDAYYLVGDKLSGFEARPDEALSSLGSAGVDGG
jgi:peptide/nickel transport system substrate-binding protein